MSDNDALPLGHHQLGPVVRVDVKNVHALVMRRSTARSLDSPPLPHVDERLEETVVVQHCVTGAVLTHDVMYTEFYF